MFDQKCGISTKGEMRWTREIGMGCDYEVHNVSLS